MGLAIESCPQSSYVKRDLPMSKECYELNFSKDNLVRVSHLPEISHTHTHTHTHLGNDGSETLHLFFNLVPRHGPRAIIRL